MRLVHLSGTTKFCVATLGHFGKISTSITDFIIKVPAVKIQSC